jgi:hypothetical protein
MSVSADRALGGAIRDASALAAKVSRKMGL